MVVKGYLDDKTYRLFEVDETNQLSQSREMVIDYPYAIEHKIRVIGYSDHKLYIDIVEISSSSKFNHLVNHVT